MFWPFDSTQSRRRPLALAAVAAASVIALGHASASAQVTRRVARATPTQEGDGTPATPPGSMAMPSMEGGPAKLDPQVEPVQVPGSLDDSAMPAGGAGDENPLPAAKERPGSAPPPAAGTATEEAVRFALPADRLSMGRQDVRLSIEVQQAGPVVNIGRETTVNLAVKNTGNVEAVGVSVVYQLPDGFEFVSSAPEKPDKIPGEDDLYYFKKPTIAAGGDWTIPVKVKATKVTSCDHAATVTAKAGARARVVVQEPKLKVEQTVNPSRVRKGERVHFQITVSNPGSGPARNVIVQAKLSDGLRLGSDDIVEQVIPVIQPREHVELDLLTVDTLARGQQTCTVDVRSPDVTPVPEDARAIRAVEVTHPDLVVTLSGHENRYTDQKNDFTLVVTNKGTATASNVKVTANMPSQGGKLLSIGENDCNGAFDRTSRKIGWVIPQLGPGQHKEFTFVYLTGGPGLYSTMAEATSGELRANARVATNVEGLVDIGIRMDTSARVIDIGDTTVYELQIKNYGTKEATKILLSGTLTTNLKVIGATGTDEDIKYSPKDGRFIFPMIDRLPPNGTLTLSIEAEAVGRGKGTCRVSLDHADLPHGEGASEENLIHAVANTTITGEGPPRVGSARSSP